MKEYSIQPKELHAKSGMLMLLLMLLGILLSVALFVVAAMADSVALIVILIIISVALLITCFICTAGLKTVRPNEALVLTLFGNYSGTITKPGFYFVNPFSSAISPAYDKAIEALTVKNEETAKKGGEAVAVLPKRKRVSLKTMTLDNGRQKVNDVLGNPIIIGAVVIWRVENPTLAVFEVEDYPSFLSTQTDSTIRNIARLYPYDIFDEDELDEAAGEKSLRGSSLEIAENMKTELQKRVSPAGIVVEEVRITHLAYAEEIAAAMLQRQQAAAIIAARQKIVDGAVGMVKMAIDRLGEDEVVVLDEERKAAMVSNLLVVLCGNKDAQPIVNSGSIY